MNKFLLVPTVPSGNQSQAKHQPHQHGVCVPTEDIRDEDNIYCKWQTLRLKSTVKFGLRFRKEFLKKHNQNVQNLFDLIESEIKRIKKVIEDEEVTEMVNEVVGREAHIDYVE